MKNYCDDECGEHPDFTDIEKFGPGVYCARYLNPPGGEDCVSILIRDDGSLGWCYRDGSQSGGDYVSKFSVEDLISED